jgi:methylphosphotriester-DNA--protein-cysteine methyltransferase
MHSHSDIHNAELARLIRAGKITLAGNRNLRIYGTLRCGSGKRMKTANRIFFENEAEAIQMGYRPCGNCMR